MSLPIVVYGATGYTGKLVTAELVSRGVPVVLSGRSAEKLAALRAAQPDSADVTVAPAPLDDPAALREAFARGGVVANCAGPFARTGRPVLEAARDAGAHYLDTTGEQHWMREVFEHHDAGLREAGVAAVPAAAFDYLPGDLLCALVAERVHGPLRRMRVVYHVEGFGMSRGTLRSALVMLDGRDVEYRDGTWREGGARPLHEVDHLPGGIGRQVVARYPAGEVLTVPRHVDVREVVARITAVTSLPGRAAPLLPLLAPALAPLMRTHLRDRLDRAIGRLPEGPPEDERRAVRWTVVAQASGEDGTEVQGVVSGPDVYGLTGRLIADVALQLAAPGFTGAGALAPAQALDAESFLDSLADAGVRWSRAPVTVIAVSLP